MDVIGFICVSLGSRRACAGSEAGFSSQNGDRARGVYCRRTALCAFMWAKGLNAVDKEMIAVYGWGVFIE
jgi:hypothetical protein